MADELIVLANGETVRQEFTPPTPPVPQSVTRAQALLALEAAGHLDDIEAYMATAPRAVQINWNERLTFERYHSQVLDMQAMFEWSDEYVDALFQDAKTR